MRCAGSSLVALVVALAVGFAPLLSEAERTVMEPGPLTNAEIARRGQELYESKLRAVLEPDHMDKVIAIDVLSGASALGESILEATARLRESQPNAVCFSRRVGPRPLRTFGWFPRSNA